MKINPDLIDNGKILWTNNDSTSNFPEQTITLSDNLSNYNFYEIIYKQSTTVTRYMSTGKIPIGFTTELPFISTTLYYRVLSESNSMTNNKILISEGKRVRTYGTSEQLNSINIPIYVIGYKGNYS